MSLQRHTPDEALPDDAVLDELTRNQLRSIAAPYGLNADKNATAKDLRRALKRLREGGRVLKCCSDKCGKTWVYQGTGDNYATTCPTCRTSVAIEANTVDRRYIDGDEDDAA